MTGASLLRRIIYKPMTRKFHFSLLLILFPSIAQATAEFFEQIEQAIPVRSNGMLQVLNNRGDIKVEGWAQDRIRLVLRKKTIANDPVEAKRLLSSAVVNQRWVDGNLEVAAEYGRGLSLQERLQEREASKTSMEMTLLAPAKASLQVLAQKGTMIVRNWKGGVEVRSGAGEIEIENIKGGAGVFVLCPGCAIRASEVRSPLRCIGGGKSITLREIEGEQVYVENDSGDIRGSGIRGDQLYVSKSGALGIARARGRVEFYTRGGDVNFEGLEGSLSGWSNQGSITARIGKWNVDDKAIIETGTGKVQLFLPRSFSGELEAVAGNGKLELEPSLGRVFESRVDSASINSTGPIKTAPEAPARRVGWIGRGGEQLKVVSEQGGVFLGFEK